MNIKTNETIQQVDIESLYRHVLALEGVKHPLENPQALARAAAYLSAQFHEAGLNVRLQPFKVEGFEDVFYNVEAWTGDENLPAVVLVAHYDNVWNDPGANNNAAGVTVLLETARILAAMGADTPPVRFVAVSLEEGNPALEIARHESLRRLGLVDENQRFRTYAVAQMLNQLNDFTLAALWSGDTYGDGYARFIEHYDDQIPQDIHEHLKDLTALIGRYDALSSIGVVSQIGSSVWLRETLRNGRNIQLAVCLDEIGTVIPLPHSQRFPGSMPFELAHTYRVDMEQRIGDFIMVISNARSRSSGDAIYQSSQETTIDLPCMWLPVPESGVNAVRRFPQAPGSDHVPFWLVDMPAISITDTAFLRNPYTHTAADTIDKVDFVQVRKICQAVLHMILESGAVE